MLHQNEEVTQERGGDGIQETEDTGEKKTKVIIKILVKKPKTKVL